ncbi:hypothetical protein B7P43_G01481 [Cryptotermes secundus]|uniref:Uncharacterized protein n=1 Tax=Cryptotermes secundus TaxID=105785 RepID=A0A2J7RK87_9NEOP|nr:hypothetical protein B7P43_G01481 [Cryptotermes secundus]
MAKLDSYQEKAEISLKELLARLEDDRQTDRRELKEMMDINQARTDVKLQELTERTGKTQRELQSVEVSLCTLTDKFQENPTKNYNETCAAIDETKREFQAWLDIVQMRTERGITPTISAGTAQLLTFNGNSTWSVFRRQF